MLRPLRGEEGELQLYVGAVKKQRARPPTLPSTEAPTPLVSHTFSAEHWGSSGTHDQLINAATLHWIDAKHLTLYHGSFRAETNVATIMASLRIHRGRRIHAWQSCASSALRERLVTADV